MTRLLCLLCLTPALALAAPPEGAESLVNSKLLAPLAAKERQRSRLSRAPLPPLARRVRVLEPLKDGKGAEFFSFAIDTRHGFFRADDTEEAWTKDATTGCVYVETGKLFVKLGGQLFPSDVLLGKKVKPAQKGLCEAKSPEA